MTDPYEQAKIIQQMRPVVARIRSGATQTPLVIDVDHLCELVEKLAEVSAKDGES